MKKTRLMGKKSKDSKVITSSEYIGYIGETLEKKGLKVELENVTLSGITNCKEGLTIAVDATLKEQRLLYRYSLDQTLDSDYKISLGFGVLAYCNLNIDWSDKILTPKDLFIKRGWDIWYLRLTRTTMSPYNDILDSWRCNICPETFSVIELTSNETNKKLIEGLRKRLNVNAGDCLADVAPKVAEFYKSLDRI